VDCEPDSTKWPKEISLKKKTFLRWDAVCTG